MSLRLVQGTLQVVKKSNYNIKLCQCPDLDKSDVVESEFVFPTDDIFEEDFDHFVRQSVLQHLHHASPELVRSRLQPKHFEHDLVFTWVRGSTVRQISVARYVKIRASTVPNITVRYNRTGVCTIRTLIKKDQTDLRNSNLLFMP